MLLVLAVWCDDVEDWIIGDGWLVEGCLFF
jgi:hypothetical protein